MPYSRKHNVLFIHIPKCAGKSFEVALGIANEKEVTRYKWRSNSNRLAKFLLGKTKDKKALSRLWGTHDLSLALQHVTYAEIELLNLLPNDTLKNSIKVAIVRNPYDRAVSSYHHMGKAYSSFPEFLKSYYDSKNRDHNALAHKRPQIDFLRDKKGNLVVDNIIRFESLNNEFEFFKSKHGIVSGSIPHIGKQRENMAYKKYYCQESKALAEELFLEDFSELGYDIENFTN